PATTPPTVTRGIRCRMTTTKHRSHVSLMVQSLPPCARRTRKNSHRAQLLCSLSTRETNNTREIQVHPAPFRSLEANRLRSQPLYYVPVPSGRNVSPRVHAPPRSLCLISVDIPHAVGCSQVDARLALFKTLATP